MRQRVKNLLNRSLSPLGLEIMSSNVAQALRQSYGFKPQLDVLFRELEGAFRAQIFPDLPECPNRMERLSNLLGTTPSEALYLLGSLHRCLALPGDVCEFGVAQGRTSALLGNELNRFTQKDLWLFDSFEGLPKPTEEDVLIDDIFSLGSMDKYQGTMACPETMVRKELESIAFPSSRLHIIKGFVKDSIKNGKLPKQVAFSYVDFDFYEPIRDALDFLESVMPVGGVIVVDDYGFFSAGAQQAVDEFIKARPGQWKHDLPPSFAGHFAILSRIA